MGQPRPLLFLYFSNTKIIDKTVGFSGIRTQIVGVEGKPPDHLTTTTAQLVIWLATFNQSALFQIGHSYAMLKLFMKSTPDRVNNLFRSIDILTYSHKKDSSSPDYLVPLLH